MSRNYDGKIKKKNTVWSDKLLEDSLCDGIDTINSFANKNDENVIKVNDRDIESYQYTIQTVEANENSFQAKRNHLSIDSNLLNFAQKEKNTVKNADLKKAKESAPVRTRLGDLVTYDQTKSRSHILVSEIDSEELVAKEISKYLKEDNLELIQRCVKALGRKKALEILYATEDIQENGGMLTNDGFRKRSPGGVYLQLVRKDDTILKCQKKIIFIEDSIKKKKQKQMKRLAQRKRFENAKNELTKQINEKKNLASRINFNNQNTSYEKKEDAHDEDEDFMDEIEEDNMIYFED